MPIRSFPIECLCPKCKAGFMRSSNMNAAHKAVGRFKRYFYTCCDRCGHKKPGSTWCFGRRRPSQCLPPCKTNADIEVFPARLLCPECKQGRLMLSNMSSKDIRVGPHWRFAQHKCDRCGWTKRMAREYFGVEEPEAVTTCEASDASIDSGSADGVRHLVG